MELHNFSFVKQFVKIFSNQISMCTLHYLKDVTEEITANYILVKKKLDS